MASPSEAVSTHVKQFCVRRQTDVLRTWILSVARVYGALNRVHHNDKPQAASGIAFRGGYLFLVGKYAPAFVQNKTKNVVQRNIYVKVSVQERVH